MGILSGESTPWEWKQRKWLTTKLSAIFFFFRSQQVSTIKQRNLPFYEQIPYFSRKDPVLEGLPTPGK